MLREFFKEKVNVVLDSHRIRKCNRSRHLDLLQRFILPRIFDIIIIIIFGIIWTSRLYLFFLKIEIMKLKLKLG